jgi:hypothetical protein
MLALAPIAKQPEMLQLCFRHAAHRLSPERTSINQGK